MTSQMDKAEFCDRFVKRMLEIVYPRTEFDDGDSIEEYAREAAPSYWKEQHTEDPTMTPEELALEDTMCWEEG